jgi:hypothetical protein
MRQCLGGWCARRESCGHFNAEPDKWGTPPSERLCDFGETAPATLYDAIEAIDAHQAMQEAHMIMLQSIKYPDTVNKQSSDSAREFITQFCKHWLGIK